MKKPYVIILSVLGVILLGLVLYTLTSTRENGQTQTPTSTTVTSTSPNAQTSNFSGGGAIVRDLPGLKPARWYLTYEQPGSPALTLELSFNDASRCYVNGRLTSCLSLPFHSGQRIEVIGNKTDTTLEVMELKGMTNLENDIRVSNPQPGATIKSPVAISGMARGTWFFEASFPVQLVDAQGGIIAQTPATAQGEWMTENFVPFTAQLNFLATSTQAGELVFKKDNPSGLPQFDAEKRIPVIIQGRAVEERKVVLYYYNSANDRDNTGNVLCSKLGLVPVERQIPLTQTPIQDTIRLLLQGKLTPAERTQGITTEYPLSGFELTGASLTDSKLALSFADPLKKTNGGACRIEVLWMQIEETAKQFEQVKEVKFFPPELFQP